MGYTTDFIGYIDIEPALNEAEIEYLMAFSASRRFDRPDGPYAVPGNPYAEDSEGIPIELYNANAIGQPGLWCQWVPAWDGSCLTFDGHEKFYNGVEWLRYLIKNFLAPKARASVYGGKMFADFTFDHILNGTIAGSRRDNRELFLIKVTSNRVVKKVLREGDPMFGDLVDLPYEQEIDRVQVERSKRRRVR